MNRIPLRCILLAVVLAVLPSGSGAEETAVRLNVQPMPAPKPALKYLLLPDVGELNSGNPVHGYVRCFAEQRSFFFSKESIAARIRYQTMPLNELPKEML